MVRGTHAGPEQAGECAQKGAWGEGAERFLLLWLGSETGLS